MENTFKSSVFGGFNRDDVIRYIEKTALENKQQLEQLEQENDGLCRESAALRTELSDAARAHDELSASYSASLEMQVSLKKELSAAHESLSALQEEHSESEQRFAAFREQSAREMGALREDCARKVSELEAAHAKSLGELKARCEAQIASLTQERDQLREENAALAPQVEEYARVKAHIADIELSARERADALDAATRAQLSALIEACSKQCELVLSTLGTTCASVCGELRRADAMVSQLPAAFSTLQADLQELQKLEKEN